jgi:Ca-activated chloride channel family protein
MIIFERDSYLLLLLFIPVLICLYVLFLRWRKLRLELFDRPQLVKKLIIGFNPKLDGLRFLLRLSAIALLIFAGGDLGLWRDQHEPKNSRRHDFIFAVDVSNSMLVEDILPNRLERSKKIMHEITDAMGEAAIGLVIFGGKAYTYLPVTDDIGPVHRAINELDVALVDRQGTSLKDALVVAAQSFVDGQANERTICVISDGESHGRNFKKTADSIKKAGINIISVAVGTPAGGKIILSGLDQKKIAKKNVSGEDIISKLNRRNLLSVAGSKASLFTATDDNFPVGKFLERVNRSRAGRPVPGYSLYKE